MYIIVDEFGEVNQTDKLTPGMLEGSDQGYIMSIIDTNTMSEYMDGTWIPIKDWSE